MMNRTVLLLAGAVSAGVHAGLAPEHLHEWPPLGAAFVAAAAAAALAVAALVLRPASLWPPRVLGALLGGMIVAYALTRLAALPPLDPDREALDLLGVCTCAVEAAGLVAAVRPRLTLVTPGGPT
jgi:hypothetical protein